MPTPTPVRIDPSYGIKAVPGEKLPWEQVEGWLVGSRNYWICTTRPDGRPHAKPVWGAWIDDRALWSTGDGECDRTQPGRQPGRGRARGERRRDRDPRGHVRVRARREPDRPLRRGLRREVPHPARSLEEIYGLRPDTCLAWTEADYPTRPRAGCSERARARRPRPGRPPARRAARRRPPRCRGGSWPARAQRRPPASAPSRCRSEARNTTSPARNSGQAAGQNSAWARPRRARRRGRSPSSAPRRWR